MCRYCLINTNMITSVVVCLYYMLQYSNHIKPLVLDQVVAHMTVCPLACLLCRLLLRVVDSDSISSSTLPPGASSYLLRRLVSSVCDAWIQGHTGDMPCIFSECIANAQKQKNKEVQHAQSRQTYNIHTMAHNKVKLTVIFQYCLSFLSISLRTLGMPTLTREYCELFYIEK